MEGSFYDDMGRVVSFFTIKTMFIMVSARISDCKQASILDNTVNTTFDGTSTMKPLLSMEPCRQGYVTLVALHWLLPQVCWISSKLSGYEAFLWEPTLSHLYRGFFYFNSLASSFPI